MIPVFQEERLLTCTILLLLLLSIICQIMIGVLYQNMINETDNMSATNNKILKQCKLKFVNCYQLNFGVANIPIFVEKFINRLCLGKISIDTIRHLSGQMVLLAVFCAGVGISRGLGKGRSPGYILPFYIISLLGLYLYFSVSALVDIRGKKRVLKVNLVDYLENHMVSRLEAQMPEPEYEMQEELPDRKKLFTGQEEQELEELLREFLA